MLERCRNRDCYQGNTRKTANMMPPTRNGCTKGGANGVRDLPCDTGNTVNRVNTPLLRRLQALDFSIVDTVLYLDAYPNCRSALGHYHRLIAERDDLLRRLAKEGNPVTVYENGSADAWDWGKGPWPWEPSAN